MELGKKKSFLNGMGVAFTGSSFPVQFCVPLGIMIIMLIH
jgi:hypothetical protein